MKKKKVMDTVSEQATNWKKSFVKIIDVLAWVGFAIVFLYLIGKAVGLIHSPPVIDVAAILGAGVFIGRYATKMDIIFKDVEKIKEKCPAFKK